MNLKLFGDTEDKSCDTLRKNSDVENVTFYTKLN